MKPMFPLGQILVTPKALETLQEINRSAQSFLDRHVLGDWGDLVEEDKKQNDLAVDLGERILSEYNLPDDSRLYVITEADRSATTILLADEY